MRDRVDRAREVVGHTQDIAGKAGRGIGAGFVLLAFETAAHVLRFGLCVKYVLLGRFQIAAQRFERLGGGISIVRALTKVFGDALQFVFRRLIQRLVILGHLVWLSIQAMSLPSERAVISTMGTTRA